jgi:hypothetical protein
MKLSTARLRRTLDQLEEQAPFSDTVAVPDESPVLPKLHEVFGEHTFFLDSEGLHIVEPARAGAADAATGQVVKLASWSDAERTSLAVHRPEPTEIVVVLEPEEEA